MGIRLGYRDRIASNSRGGGTPAARDYIAGRREALTAPDRPPNTDDCRRRLRSYGYVVGEHRGIRGDHTERWHVFETDKGVVAIRRHPGGRWETRRMNETKGDADGTHT